MTEKNNIKSYGDCRKKHRALCTTYDPCGFCQLEIGLSGSRGSMDNECPMQGSAVVLPSGEVVQESARFAMISGCLGHAGRNIGRGIVGGLRLSAMRGDPVCYRFGPGPDCERQFFVFPIFNKEKSVVAYRVTVAPAYE